ncbi:MAG: hypothetical protein ABSE19_04175 [Candidatus Acidiferrum sp.]
MKKSLLVLIAALSVSLILLSIAVPVNNSSTLPTWNNGAIQADGVPLPPPWMPKVINANLVADGVPLPPPWMPKVINANLVADGVPLPPPWMPKVINANLG